MADDDPHDFRGVLCIGDPHLAVRAPGFRKDDYAQTVLQKLRWCVSYAQQRNLLIVLLGDLFHHPRDVANWLLVDLINLFSDQPTFAVAGNHDCHENALSDDDTLSVLAAAGAITLLDRAPTRGVINGCDVIIGGTAWGQSLPSKFDRLPYQHDGRPSWVLWITHHDVRFPGYEETGRFGCFEIDGVDLVINGHIHRQLSDVVCGRTTWMNPGNICRVSRGDVAREHKPCALRLDFAASGWSCQRVEIPHLPFDDVFYADVDAAPVRLENSIFVQQLAALEAQRTASGAGLESFLDANLAQFDEQVQHEIRLLAKEVLSHG